ncbi:MAG: YebC/PmpR family DNA-binding transcriptional regulator [Clostridia bacterium]|nr:YebC/PmpR family DNA-binding transcriptional regulator [Clostridia bacterium]MBR5902689.1 YebC/PmpR family DNA-binding transcriptional regulator [Clostridia bacterium]
MSGHSKWHNIQKTKGAADAKKAKIFTKYAREMAIAIKDGGGADPASNSKLSAVISRAKSENVPNDNINRILQKYQSGAAAESYEHVTYEGYGPCGIAVIVETLTDNRNRTVADVRHYFDKYGGNMGTSGCVSWQFSQKGVIVIDGEDLDEDAVMMEALDAGAEDFSAEEGIFEVYTDPDSFDEVREKLKEMGYEFMEAQVQMVPQNYITISGEDNLKNMQKMLEVMEANDDIQNVWHNWEETEN